MKKLYEEEELRTKSYYELYEIAMAEKLIEAYMENPTREQLINIILKYRGLKASNDINIYNENGLHYVQMLFDTRLAGKLHHEYRIKIPHKIIIYKGFDLTREDNYKIIIPEYINSGNVFLVNANNYLCGILSLEKDVDSRDAYYLTSKQEFMRLDDLQNNKFSLLFFKEADAVFPYNFYNMQDGKENELYPFKLDYYKVDIESFEYRTPEETTATLCIDFGTTNTVAGAYIDQNYVRDLPTNDILNGNIKLNEINYVKFPDGERGFSIIYPTLAYVEDCRNPKNIKFLFGHDVTKKLEANDYIVNGTLFYGLKKWVHDKEEKEKVVDEFGNIRYIPRKDIIRAYLKYVVERAEYLFKCKFKRIHASSPVRLKEQFLNMFQEIFTIEVDEAVNEKKVISVIKSGDDKNSAELEKKFDNETGEAGKKEVISEIEEVEIETVTGKKVIQEYEIIRDKSMDEAIAVLYNTIESQMRSKDIRENQEYKALIIDCGGGTTDLAACRFTVGNTQNVAFHLDIRTSFENGDENFGGNNLTYRIMQYLKIILAGNYTERNIDMNYLLPFETDIIYRMVDDLGVNGVFKTLQEEYDKAEKIIPTKFSKFENKLSDEYRKIKNNFYLLWEAAENLKKEFFKRDDTLRTRFDNFRNFEKSNDFHITVLKSWNLHILENGLFRKETVYPANIFTIKEMEKLVKIDIYGMLKKFLNTYYEEGLLYNYALIKLSGQSARIGVFQEVLKEFVPGRQIEFKTRGSDDEGYDLKLSCLDGVIKYLDYRRFGHMNVEIINEIPLVPYSVWGETYKGEPVEIIRTSRRANENLGYIDKVSSVIELKLYLKNVEDQMKKEFVYKNDIDFVDKDVQPIIHELREKISQNETDNVPNGITRFLVYTDENCWGFYVCPIRRRDDQIYMGKPEYYPFENDLNEISFFDGEH
ncbi:Uncharacterised protein [Sebaldella termitidis]|jgi:hypothetical protein|uniref:Molecular chaperone-like protein n=1 Tax=Sebaldella termitidis (strain ATCC 33386 / NCTC 11300) TaxID=526218 RepID=D1AH49_SEBTE|nr:molecular chaperone [Sebaldella termitidis]ACZ08083.1 hypothetical protein Sterm_1215 [Sebaldella termitidis ATCC 33386]SUI23384.1 Uncharacterised protein [Sebaldella termitidis]